MELAQLFLERHGVLCAFYLEGLWDAVAADAMRRRPDPRLNSIAWNMWHIARVEDSGINRFVADRQQVLDAGDWMLRLKLPWRHHGSGMTFAEVDQLSAQIDLAALRGYAAAVHSRTREVVAQLDEQSLDATMDSARLRLIVIDEGLAHSDGEGLVQNYLGWSKGKCLLHFGLTHSFQHVGEMETIASLLDVQF